MFFSINGIGNVYLMYFPSCEKKVELLNRYYMAVKFTAIKK